MSAVSPFFLVGERDGGVVSPSCSRSSSGKEDVLRTERRQRDRVERERGEGDFFYFISIYYLMGVWTVGLGRENGGTGNHIYATACASC